LIAHSSRRAGRGRIRRQSSASSRCDVEKQTRDVDLIAHSSWRAIDVDFIAHSSRGVQGSRGRRLHCALIARGPGIEGSATSLRTHRDESVTPMAPAGGSPIVACPPNVIPTSLRTHRDVSSRGGEGSRGRGVAPSSAGISQGRACSGRQRAEPRGTTRDHNTPSSLGGLGHEVLNPKHAALCRPTLSRSEWWVARRRSALCSLTRAWQPRGEIAARASKTERQRHPRLDLARKRRLHPRPLPFHRALDCMTGDMNGEACERHPCAVHQRSRWALARALGAGKGTLESWRSSVARHQLQGNCVKPC
jgi:hypothetical protein